MRKVSDQQGYALGAVTTVTIASTVASTATTVAAAIPVATAPAPVAVVVPVAIAHFTE